MTDNEIIKALECCSTSKSNEDCKKTKCPLFDKDIDMCGTINSETIIQKNALDLINRQKAEIERLKCALHKYIDKDDIKEIEMYEALAETRVNAIKEFAERLKELPSMKLRENYWVSLLIDILVKEMVGDE